MIKEDYENIYDLDNTIAKPLLLSVTYPYEVLPKIGEYILSIIPSLGEDYQKIGDNVYAHKSAIISETASITGPCIIGENTEIRHCAFIRGNAIIGNNCVIGNSTEIKNAIIFNNVQCPHFNYVGDAIMGEYSHIGAGVILSNVRSDKNLVKLSDGTETNLKKFSAIIGSHVEVGCNSVICPGTIIFPNSTIYPLSRVRKIVKENKIYKDENNIVDRK